MKLIDSLPKNERGKIILNPAAKIDEEFIEGFVDVEWFTEKYPSLSKAEAPLKSEELNELKSIDKYWKINAEKWRKDNMI